MIVGGGFAGSCAAAILERQRDVNLTYIDSKSLFEYTPSLLRYVIGRDNIQILAPHSQYLPSSASIVTDVVERVDSHSIHMRDKSLPYDYLIASTGSSYRRPPVLHQFSLRFAGSS